MRAAAILGMGCTPRDLRPFQQDGAVDWQIGLPTGDCDAILLFGGDGTLHRHLPQLLRLGAPVLVVPRGSGNDFSRALQMTSIADSLAAWKKFVSEAGNTRTLDVGLIHSINEAGEPLTTHYFAAVANVGLDAEIARRANHLPRWMRANGGYALALPQALLPFEPFQVRVKTWRNSEWQDHPPWRILLAAFANSPLYGGGMRIAPRAEPDDGLLDICVVREVGKLRLLRLFPTVYSGKHLKIPEVEYFQAPRVQLFTDSPCDVFADGEFVCRTPVEFSLSRHALRVIVP